jgi:hypothetical protein
MTEVLENIRLYFVIMSGASRLRLSPEGMSLTSTLRRQIFPMHNTFRSLRPANVGSVVFSPSTGLVPKRKRDPIAVACRECREKKVKVSMHEMDVARLNKPNSAVRESLAASDAKSTI